MIIHLNYTAYDYDNVSKFTCISCHVYCLIKPTKENEGQISENVYQTKLHLLT